MPDNGLQFWIVTGLIGLCGGLAGGLAGIGGSLVMLPGLAIFLGYQDATHSEQHVYQAAASAVNVLVTLPSVMQHRRAGVVKREWVKMLMPIVAASVIAGVLLSNVIEGTHLKRILAGAIAAYCVWNFIRVVRKSPEREHAGNARKGVLSLIGVGAGLFSGLLGIGGGVLLVPGLEVFAKVPLRVAVGVSSSIIVVTAAIAAAIKGATLGSQGHTFAEAFRLVVALGPLAMLGGLIGAKLVHTLPLRVVRIVLTTILFGAAIRMAM